MAGVLNINEMRPRSELWPHYVIFFYCHILIIYVKSSVNNQIDIVYKHLKIIVQNYLYIICIAVFETDYLRKDGKEGLNEILTINQRGAWTKQNWEPLIV